MIFTLWHAKQQFAQCGKTQNMSLSYQMCTPLIVIAQSLGNWEEVKMRFYLATLCSWLQQEYGRCWYNHYAVDRKSRRWWVRMFVNFLEAIMVNAYIIYNENFKIMNMPASENLQSHLNMTNLCLESSKSWLEIFLAAVSLAHHQHCLPLLFMEESMILSILLSWRFSSLEDATIVASV